MRATVWHAWGPSSRLVYDRNKQTNDSLGQDGVAEENGGVTEQRDQQTV